MEQSGSSQPALYLSWNSELHYYSRFGWTGDMALRYVVVVDEELSKMLISHWM
jgi:hypothetical protein